MRPSRTSGRSRSQATAAVDVLRRPPAESVRRPLAAVVSPDVDEEYAVAVPGEHPRVGGLADAGRERDHRRAVPRGHCTRRRARGRLRCGGSPPGTAGRDTTAWTAERGRCVANRAIPTGSTTTYAPSAAARVISTRRTWHRPRGFRDRQSHIAPSPTSTRPAGASRKPVQSDPRGRSVQRPRLRARHPPPRARRSRPRIAAAPAGTGSGRA